MNAQKNALEWAVFGVSALLIGAVIAILIVTAVRSTDLPPSLQVTTGAARASGVSYQVPVQVENTGDATAEQALIEVVLLTGEREVERAELTMAFVPRHSSRKGHVIFRRDPRCCSISARVVGHESP